MFDILAVLSLNVVHLKDKSLRFFMIDLVGFYLTKKQEEPRKQNARFFLKTP